MLDSLGATYTSLKQSSKSRPNGQVVHILTGVALRRLLHGKSPQERARIAARLVKYKVALEDLSLAQIARLTEANPGSVSIELGNAGKRGARESTLDRLIRKYGADTLRRAVNRATAPTRVAAE
jgi:hypothetical protein